MSAKGKKRLNRLLRMAGRTCSTRNNAIQHTRSRRFELDVASGGMTELVQLAGEEIARVQAEEAQREAERQRLLGLFA